MDNIKNNIYKLNIKDNKKIIKSIMSISLPAVIDLLAQTMLSITDMAMVGKIGAEAIASVGLGNIAFNMILPAFMAIAIGMIAILSRAYGSKNIEEGKNVLVQSMILCIPISLIITFIYLYFSNGIIDILSKGVGFSKIDAVRYHNIVSIGFLPLSFTIIYTSAYRSINMAKIPMIINILSIFVNIILNYIFIFLLKQGVMGAAIATTLTRLIIVLIFSYLIFFTKKHWISLSIKDLKYNKFVLKRIVKTGIPAAIEQLSIRLGMVIFEMFVISLGSIPYAAHKIATVAESLSFNMGFAFSMAASAIVGQELGKGNLDKAQHNVLVSTILTLIVMSIMGLIFLLLPDLIIAFFTDDTSTKLLSAKALRIVSTCQPFLAVTMVLSGALRGAGDTKTVLFISFFGIYIIRLPFTYLFINILNMGLAGAWWVMTIDTIIRAFLFYRVFKKGNWRYISV